MHTNNRHTHSAQECYVFLFIILLYSPSSCVRRIRVNTGCVLRTRLYDIQRCYCVYGPTLTEVVRAGRAGTRVPARLRRTSADYRPISARLLATFTVARTLHRRVPHTCAAQTRCFLRYSLDMFSTYAVFIFSPYQRVYGRFCVSVTFFRESFTT